MRVPETEPLLTNLAVPSQGGIGIWMSKNGMKFATSLNVAFSQLGIHSVASDL